MNVVYVRFDKTLDYKKVVNARMSKGVCERAFGDEVDMISPTRFSFDRDRLHQFIQNQYDQSKEYLCEYNQVPSFISSDFCENSTLYYIEFEPEILLDDHIITINKGDTVLGVFAQEDDFEKIINEL